MKVWFVGAGPGAPDLITIRGAEIVSRCPIVMYTGSLVPREVIARARPDARILDSSGMTLEEQEAVYREARAADQDVARVHTGDPTIFGSIAEQIRRLDRLGIAWEIVPGVSSFTAAAARLGRELTLPEMSQTVILTRAEGRTPMPEGERLEDLARHGATIVLFLSVNLLEKVAAALAPAYGEDCPVAVVQKATCPDERIVTATLADVAERVRAAGITRQSIVLVGRVLTAEDFADSRLYAADFSHGYRKARASRPSSPLTPARSAPGRGPSPPRSR